MAFDSPQCPSIVPSHLPNHISPRAALVAFAIAMVILAQGISAPFVKDAEPQAASWIQDVAAGEDILIPHDYYGELARKPPLFYWAAGAISAATGGHVNEVRARVVSVLAGAAVAVGALIWTTEFLDLTTGWLALLFLLGSYAFTSRGTLALEDMMLVAFMFAAWCLIYTTLEEGPSRRRTIEIGIVLGLGYPDQGASCDRAAGVRRVDLSADDAAIDLRGAPKRVAMDGARDRRCDRAAMVSAGVYQQWRRTREDHVPGKFGAFSAEGGGRNR